MVLTQWAFIGPALLWPRELGLNPNDDWGMMGLVEVMAEVGRQLGVREELNMCSGGLKEAREYALLLHRRIQQHLSQPSELADDMSTQLLSGANILNPFIRLISSIKSTNILRFLDIANIAHFVNHVHLFIRPRAFRTWAFGLLNPQNTDETGLEGPDRVLFKLQASHPTFARKCTNTNFIAGVGLVQGLPHSPRFDLAPHDRQQFDETQHCSGFKMGRRHCEKSREWSCFSLRTRYSGTISRNSNSDHTDPFKFFLGASSDMGSHFLCSRDWNRSDCTCKLFMSFHFGSYRKLFFLWLSSKQWIH